MILATTANGPLYVEPARKESVPPVAGAVGPFGVEPDADVPQVPSLPLWTQIVNGPDGTESGACACSVYVPAVAKETVTAPCALGLKVLEPVLTVTPAGRDSGANELVLIEPTVNDTASPTFGVRDDGAVAVRK